VSEVPFQVSIGCNVDRAVYALSRLAVRLRRQLRAIEGDPWAEWHDLGGEA